MDCNICDPHFSAIDQIIKKKLQNNPDDYLEGNSLYHNKRFVLRRGNNMDNLRHNLLQLGKNHHSVLEVGFNGGHSAILFYLKNPQLQFLCFDIASHCYTEECAKYLNKHFDSFTFVKGNSVKEIPLYYQKNPHKYDIFHIDGGHSKKIAYADIVNCSVYRKEKSIIVFDGPPSTHPHLNQLLDFCVSQEYIVELSYTEYPYLRPTIYHRLFHYGDKCPTNTEN